MALRIRKEPPKEGTTEKRSASHLRLVKHRPPHIAKSKRQHAIVVWLFLAVFVSTLSVLTYLSVEVGSPPRSLFDTLTALRSSVAQNGLPQFQAEKAQLKSLVSNKLTRATSEAETNDAHNVAVYLFPELLPNEDFEKTVALEDWKPMQEAIEKRPKSPESRIWFEEMRANIWNYESPDRGNPQLSQYAKEILRLYDELSAP